MSRIPAILRGRLQWSRLRWPLAVGMVTVCGLLLVDAQAQDESRGVQAIPSGDTVPVVDESFLPGSESTAVDEAIDPPPVQESQPEQESRPLAGRGLFRMPNLFRRKSEADVSQPVVTPPETARVRVSGDGSSVATERFLQRAVQLLNDARQLESDGHDQAALDMARRADAVFGAASRTTQVRWPAGQETPAQYAGRLSARIEQESGRSSFTLLGDSSGTASFRAGSVPDPTVTIPTTSAPSLQLPNTGIAPSSLPYQQPARTAANMAATVPSRGDTGGVLPDSQSRGESADNGQGRAAQELMLNWGDRAAIVQTPAGHAPDGMTLTGGERQARFEARLPNGSAGDESANAGTDSSPVRDALRQQLNRLDRASVPAKLALPAQHGFESHDQYSSDRELIPGEPEPASDGDRHSQNITGIPSEIGIEDQMVAPIPTHLPGGAVTTREPGFLIPDASRPLHDATNRRSQIQPSHTAQAAQPGSPWLLPDVVSSEPSTPQPDSLWQAALTQVLATCAGVLLAVGIFLLLRAVASRLWGTGLGLTFQIGSDAGSRDQSAAASAVLPVSGTSQVETPVVVEHPQDLDSEQEPAVLPFPGSRNPEAPFAVDAAGGGFPFRLVGGSAEDDRQTKEEAARERDEAILKHIFDQNVRLMDELKSQKSDAA